MDEETLKKLVIAGFIITATGTLAFLFIDLIIGALIILTGGITFSAPLYVLKKNKGKEVKTMPKETQKKEVKEETKEETKEQKEEPTKEAEPEPLTPKETGLLIDLCPLGGLHQWRFLPWTDHPDNIMFYCIQCLKITPITITTPPKKEEEGEKKE